MEDRGSVSCYLCPCTYKQSFTQFFNTPCSGKLWCTHMASASSVGGWITNRDRHLCASVSSWSAQTSERRFLYRCGSEVRAGSERTNKRKTMHSDSPSVKDLINTETGKFPATGPLQGLLQCPPASASEEQARGSFRPALSHSSMEKIPKIKG